MNDEFSTELIFDNQKVKVVKIVRCSDLIRFEQNVNAYLKDGFELYGEMVIAAGGHSVGSYHQMMVLRS